MLVATDNDAAGRKAAEADYWKLTARGADPRELLIPGANDPAELYQHDPQTLARQLLILIDGAITVALVMGDHSAADNAQCVARKLLDL